MTTEVTVVGDMSREKIELIKQTVAKGATDLELELFLHACKRTGLDPLMKQIYAIKRWNSQEKRETMTMHTWIDGYRLIADRTGRYAGSSDAVYEEDAVKGVMRASVTVTKMVSGVPCHFTASARWDEYVQMTRDNQPTTMWKKMPYLMLAKCAEALALRKAFPAELSGVYTHEEMMQDDTEPVHTVMQNKQTAQAKINELRREGAEPATPPAAVTEPVPSREPVAEVAPASPQQAGAGAPSSSDEPPEVEAYRAKIRTAHDSKAAQEAYNSTPEHFRQDVFPAYSDKLKSFNKKK